MGGLNFDEWVTLEAQSKTFQKSLYAYWPRPLIDGRPHLVSFDNANHQHMTMTLSTTMDKHRAVMDRNAVFQTANFRSLSKMSPHSNPSTQDGK